MYGDLSKPIAKTLAVLTLLTLAVVVAGCSGSSTAPTATAKSASPAAGSTTTSGDEVAQGAAIWAQKPCQGCHGDKGQGGAGPKLAGTTLSFDQVKKQVRTPRGVMLAFSESQVSDADLQSMYTWLKSLK